MEVAGFTTLAYRLLGLFDQGASLAFLLKEDYMTMQVLACIRRFHFHADTLDYVRHVLRYTCIVAPGIAKLIKGSAEQSFGSNGIENKAQCAMPVMDIRASRTPSGKQRQTIPHTLQAGHGSERVIDSRRHGPDSHFRQLIHGIFDIPGRCARVFKREGDLILYTPPYRHVRQAKRVQSGISTLQRYL
jgi:hypothetical protein